jgi:DNA polymerase-3 subunit epsilon
MNTITDFSTLSAVPNGAYRFIALDVETANGNAHSICQIGLACVHYNGQMDSYSQFINPFDDFSSFNINLHGISETTVEHAPDFETVLHHLRPLLDQHTLIQHSSFDKRAMNAACDRHDLPNLLSVWLDSVVISRTAWPEFKGNGGHGLAHLKKQLNLDFKHHDAAEDARAAAQVVLLAEQHTDKPFQDLAKGKVKKLKKSPPPSAATPA